MRTSGRGAPVLYRIARRDRLFRHPPTDEDARLAYIDQSIPTLVFLVSIPIAVLVSGPVARCFWLSLVVIGPIAGGRTDCRRRRERRQYGLVDDER